MNPAKSTAPTIVNGSSIASAVWLAKFFTRFWLGGVAGKLSRFLSSCTKLFFKQQLPRAAGGFHYCFDERHAEFAFFQFQNAVNGASSGSGHCVLQERGMIACFEDDTCRA